MTAAITVVDALGRTVRLEAPATRIVSLVPSETEAVAELRGLGVLAGRTTFCEEPGGAVEAIPTVGGTKKFDVDAVALRKPDLVLANKEENARPLVVELLERGLTVHVSFPQTVLEAVAYLRNLARMLGLDPDTTLAVREAARAADAAYRARRRPEALCRVFVPIWKDPWMTFDGRTFGSDILELAGGENVFADRPRRYPLAADLGAAPALSSARTEGRDTRYPRTTLDEVTARRPDRILLPDEPYAFTEADAERLRPIAETHFVCGKDLFWYGPRIARALRSLGEALL